MARLCPNINSPEWKKLVSQVGETNAYRIFLHNNEEVPSEQAVDKYIEHYRKYLAPTKENITKLALDIPGIRKYKGNIYITQHGFVTANNGINKLNKELGYRAIKKKKLDQAGKDGREIWAIEINTDKAQTIPEIEEISDTEFVYGGEIYASKEDALKAKDQYDAGMYFQANEDTRPVDPVIEGRMKEIISEMGIDLMDYKEYAEWYKGAHGTELSHNAVADMFKNVIAVKQGTEGLSTLPEETAHFIVYALQNDPAVQKALSEVHLTEEWKNEADDYKAIYRNYPNTDHKVRMEILGKVMANSLIKGVKTEKRSFMRTLDRIWNRFLSLFSLGSRRKEQKLRESIDAIANDVLADPNSIKERLREQRENTTVTDHFFQIDPANFENSYILKDMKKELKDAIATINKKIKVAEARGLKTFTEREKKLRGVLLADLGKNRTTQGIVNFIEHVEGEAEMLLDSLVSMREAYIEGMYDNELNKFSKVLKEMNTYVSVYSPIVDRLISETATDLRKVTNEGGDTRKHEALLKALHNINDGITAMNDAYKTYGKDIFISSFRPFLERRFEGRENADELIEQEFENLMQQMEHKDGDISSARRYLDSMAESTDDLLALTDRLVKEEIELSNLETERMMRELIDLDAELKLNGITTDFMYERDSDGNLTGHLISEYNNGAFNKAKDEFFDDLHKRMGLPLGRENKWERDIMKGKMSATQLADYNREVREWFAENTSPNTEWRRIRDEKLAQIKEQIITEKRDKTIIARQEEHANEIFDAWFADRYVTTFDSPDVSFRKEFAAPADKYRNPKFRSEMNNPIKKKYYDRIMTLRRELTKHMGDEFSESMLAPQIRRDVLERAKNDPKATVTETLNDIFIRQKDDTAFGDPLTDEKGNRIRRIPIFYFNELKNMQDLSTDLTATMTLFADMSNRHRHLNRIVDIVEIGGDIIAERSVSRKLMGDVVSGGEAAERYKDYVNMVIYGEMKKDEGNLLGTQIDQAKFIDALNKYTSMNSLAFNVFAGFSNITLGNILINGERFAKEFVTGEDLKFATKKYWGKDGVQGVMKDMGKTRSENKLRLFFEQFDVLQDWEGRAREVNTDRGRWGRMFNNSSVFFINHIGEHQMQGRMALALAHNKKVKNAAGQEIPFYEALEVKNYRLQFKEGMTNLNGKPLTDKDIVAFKLRMKGINQRLHGVYNQTDRSAIQKWSLGRAAMLFRKWMKPGFNRRFDKKYYNYALDTEVEGTYRTAVNFMRSLYNEMKETQFSIAAAKDKYAELPDWQKANMVRALHEVSWFVAASVAGAILSNFAADDDDNWILNMAAYQANRLSTELGIYIPPWSASEGLKLLKSPAAAVNQIDHITNFINVFSLEEDYFLDRYERGRHAGDLKLTVWTKKAIPFVDSIEDWFYPEERLKYFAN